MRDKKYDKVEEKWRKVAASLNHTFSSLSLFLPSDPDRQYGFVNYALELLVLKNFGLEIWEKIK